MNKKMILLVLIFLGFSSLFTIDLTKEESHWIAEHPNIQIGISESWAPFVIIDENGSLSGFDIDYMNRINEITGLNLKLVAGKWPDIVIQAKARDIDGLAESCTIEKRKEFFNYTDSYNSQFYLLATTPDKLGEFKDSESYKDKTVSLLRGNAWVQTIIDVLDFKKSIKTNSEYDSFSLVMEGEVDCSFLPLAMYLELKKVFYENLVIAHVFDEDQFRLNLVYSIRKDWPELVTILNKGIAAISHEETSELIRKWMGVYPQQPEIMTALTEEEILWLKNHPVIKMAPDPNFPPLDFFDEKGNYLGISADYMKLIEKNLGIKFDIVQCNNWDEVLSKAKNRDVDMIPAAAQTPQREKYMNYTDPFLVYPGVYITRTEHHEINKISDLKDKKVAIVSGYAWEEFFALYHKEIETVKVLSLKEGLREVSMGNLDVLIGTLPIVLHYIEEEGISNLKIAGETGFYTKLSIHTRKDWPILGNIMKKSLANIPEEEKERINAKWISFNKKSIFNDSEFRNMIIMIVGISLVVILFVLLWNFSLKKQVTKRTLQLEKDYEKRRSLELELQENEEKYKLMVENHVDMLTKIDPEGNLLYVSPSYCVTFGKSEMELLGRKYLPLVHPDDIGHTEQTMKQLYRSPNTCYYEQRAKTVSGWRWLAWNNKAILDDNGEVKEIIGLGRDITDQKNFQVELNKAAIEWQNTFDASNDAIWIIDKNHKILRWNKTTFSIFHMEDRNLTGKYCYEIVHKGNQVFDDCPGERAMQTLKRETMELPMEDKWLEITVDPILDEQGKYIASVHVISDITERKKLTLELQKHRDNLEETVKERTAELEKKNKELENFNQLFVGREFRVKDLKDKIIKLENELKELKG